SVHHVYNGETTPAVVSAEAVIADGSSVDQIEAGGLSTDASQQVSLDAQQVIAPTDTVAEPLP
ncbi:MAG TPA: hypothetical protein GX717_08625, partial [Clostridiaceae bacterium]|nr:hypothetical protein [Clostridiaceae bacterium]